MTVSVEMREELGGHRGAVLWFTGLSGAGKTSIAHRVAEGLHAEGVRTFLLDGDVMRAGLNEDLGFSHEDRTENVRRLAHIASLFASAGVVVLVAAISPYRKDRELARGRVRPGGFVEVFVDSPLEVCEARDPKGLYRRARAGQVREFTGISAPYEAPEHPELVLESGEKPLHELVRETLALIHERGVLLLE